LCKSPAVRLIIFGITYAVLNGKAEIQHKLKKTIKSNPEAFKEFKKAINIRFISVAAYSAGIVFIFLSDAAATPKGEIGYLIGTGGL
jgi:hypothetical protein